MIDSHSPAPPQPYADIHELTADIAAYPGCGYPSGVHARIWRAIDKLKDSDCPPDSLARAEKIAVAMTYLQSALRARGSHRVNKTRVAKTQLGKLGQEWRASLPVASNQS